MAALELEVLFELRRIPEGSAAIVAGLGREIGLAVSEASFAHIVEQARTLAWTRDPFDRLVIASAMADEARLLTADATILDHFRDAVW